ncbi:winged helix-turn-helix domain-containing protein [Vibrio parahaemolyticus]|nr:winged helix-turn-helix domain-containing protein [Vibrio parahaemolyticus]
MADDISQRKIAAQLNISLSSVQRIVKQLKQDDPL